VAAHAALAPERGRSALDAVMLMGNGIEFLREHIPSNSRIHYIITNGGAAPNVVPDTAELYLYSRSPFSGVLGGIWDRILKIGQGAALMTETTLGRSWRARFDGDSSAASSAGSQRGRRLYGRRRCQLECPDDRFSYGHGCAWSGPPIPGKRLPAQA
jgi:metal-dependent amidase/aminoacylase/carboxypeptidase family protein